MKKTNKELTIALLWLAIEIVRVLVVLFQQ